MRLRALPLRVRLVAGFAVAMLVVLSLGGAFVYWRVEYALDRGLDADLDRACAALTPLVGADGGVRDRRAADAAGLPWQVVGAAGAVVASGGGAPAVPLAPSDARPGVVDVGPMLPADRAATRVRVQPLASGRTLVVAVARHGRDEALRELLAQLTIAGVACLVVSCLVGERLARAALVPVERYRRAAASIAAGAIDRRLEVPDDREDEVVRLGRTLNSMLDALEAALTRERRFVQDASHELRTPLALLGSRLQLARRRPRSVAEHEEVLAELEVDLARLTRLAEELLDASTATDVRTAGDVPTDLRAVVATVAPELLDAGLDAPLQVAAPPEQVERIVANLVGNARLHGAAPVVVRLGAVGDHAVLAVEDAGPGMDAGLLAAATERFHRAPEARSRPGAGLGLAIVAELVERLGGQLRLCSAGVHHVAVAGPTTVDVLCRHGDATVVTVLLPRARAGA